MGSLGFRRVRACLVAAAVVGAVHPPPLRSQAPDAFAGHFGASRSREPGSFYSVGMGVLLLTQFDSRWKPEPFREVIEDYDGLETTVGYNYVVAGGQLSFPVGSVDLIGAASVTGGRTSDRRTKQAQDALHDFRRYPHVPRDHVSDGTWLWGVEVEGSLWKRLRWGEVDLDVQPFVGTLFAAHLREVPIGLRIGAEEGIFRLQLDGTAGLLFGTSAVVPQRVGSALGDSYYMGQVALMVDRRRYGSLARYIPSLGVGLAYSSGIFPEEGERLLSAFFEFPAALFNSSDDSVRFEFVNDLVGDKDRGPTGGIRLMYVGR